MLKKNEEIIINIDSCTALGSGVGRYNGMTVFVANSAPGDKLCVHIIKAKPNYAIGKIIKIIEPSKMRICPECSAFLKCGGCAFGHINYKDELNIKYTQVKENLERIGEIKTEPQPIIPSVNELRYRNKAQFPVRVNENGETQIGFYAPHSHRVIDCDDCLLQPEEFSKITNIFKKWIRLFKISAYNEKTKKGLLRHIYIRKAVSTNEIMVCAVINGNTLPYSDELVFELTDALPNIKSIVLNINKKDTNVVLGEKCETIFGNGYITDKLCGLEFRISPLSFYQVNHDTAEILYAKAAEYANLTGNETVLDLYCGTGTIGLSMANKAKKIIGVEIIPQAIENAKENARLNNIENAEFICGDASQAAQKLEEQGIKPDVAIVDPPRKGCDEALLQALVRMEPKKIVYVSCDSATLARDCKRLQAMGYEFVEATPTDMFPRTGHVETVVSLVRKIPDTHIDFEINLDELDLTAAESKATYQEIKDYVYKKFSLKVSSLNISQVKTKCGIIERENYNKGKDGHRVPNCSPEKENAIIDAFKHFQMI